ncbi:MAG: hypothetical protein GW893_23135, partial [Armatimonadetes bacterium]|nr:hypothetical protein [Armatimonadota bacterium]
YAPLGQGQIYSEFTNLHFHSGMGLVRDVSQILVDKSILPEVPGQAVTTADFRNRYDLLVVVVPDQVDEPFTPMQISP